MLSVTRRLSSYAAAVVLLVVGVLPVLGGRPAYAATQLVIDITASGPKPALATGAAGETVVFRNTDRTFVHQVRSESANWAFDTGPIFPGQTSSPVKVGGAGTYLYMGANLDSFHGKVVVPAAAGRSSAPTAPSPSAKAGASPAASSASSPAAASSGSPAAAVPPPLAGGYGTLPMPSASPARGAPAPAVAPPLPGPSPAPTAAASTGPVVAVGPGRLPEPATGRRYGLPAALAAVAAAGVASLLVRLLLAHPAARRLTPRSS